MAVLIITNDNYVQEVEKSTKPVLLDIYAPWCGPCQHMVPVLEEVDKELGEKYKIAKVNVDETREVAIKFGVSSIPTFVFIKDGQVKAKETGYISKDDLVEKLNKYLG